MNSIKNIILGVFCSLVIAFLLFVTVCDEMRSRHEPKWQLNFVRDYEVQKLEVEPDGVKFTTTDGEVCQFKGEVSVGGPAGKRSSLRVFTLCNDNKATWGKHGQQKYQIFMSEDLNGRVNCIPGD